MGGGGAAIAVDVAQFPRLASGCVFYLSAPASACAAVRAGRWAEETELFLDRVTHHAHSHQEEDPHSHQEDESHSHQEDESHSHQDESHSHEGGEEEGHHSSSEEEVVGRAHAEEEAGHQEEHVDVHGLEALIEELEEHFVPLDTEVSSGRPRARTRTHARTHARTHTHTRTVCLLRVGFMV